VMQLIYLDIERISVDGKVPHGEVLIHRFKCMLAALCSLSSLEFKTLFDL